MCMYCRMELSIGEEGSEVWRCHDSDVLKTREYIYQEVDEYLRESYQRITFSNRAELLEVFLLEYRKFNRSDLGIEQKLNFHAFVMMKTVVLIQNKNKSLIEIITGKEEGDLYSLIKKHPFFTFVLFVILCLCLIIILITVKN